MKEIIVDNETYNEMLKNSEDITESEDSEYTMKAINSVNREDTCEVGTQQLTFGEKLAGISFNPSNDSDVDRVKRAAASFMDAMYDASKATEALEEPAKSITNDLFKQAQMLALQAQMICVKSLTWKY